MFRRTAVLCRALHIACQSTIQAFRTYIRYRGLLSLGIPFLVLGHGSRHCLQLVGTLAVMMSASEPAGCFRGVRAFRKALWLVLGDTAPAVVLVVVRCATAAGLWLFENSSAEDPFLPRQGRSCTVHQRGFV